MQNGIKIKIKARKRQKIQAPMNDIPFIGNQINEIIKPSIGMSSKYFS